MNIQTGKVSTLKPEYMAKLKAEINKSIVWQKYLAVK